MDETLRKPFQPLPGVRWGAVATGALLGAALWLVLLRFGDVPGALTREGVPGLGLRVWWVVAPLLAAGLASWTGALAAGERGIREAYLHGLLASAGALLLAALVGPSGVGALPEPGWSGLAVVVGAVVGAALGRAQLAGRVAAPWVHSGAGRRLSRGDSALEPGTGSRPRWREVLTGRRTGNPRPGAGDDVGHRDQDLH